MTEVGNYFKKARFLNNPTARTWGYSPDHRPDWEGDPSSREGDSNRWEDSSSREGDSYSRGWGDSLSLHGGGDGSSTVRGPSFDSMSLRR